MSTKLFSNIGGTNCQRKIKSFSAEKVIPRIEQTNPEMLTSAEIDLVRDDKLFSASSVKDRLTMAKLTPKIRLSRMLRDYRAYYKANSSKIQADDAKLLQELFVGDAMGILNAVVADVVLGTSLMTLLGLGSLGPDISEAGKILSPVYIKALQAEKAMGSVPQKMYQRLTTCFDAFMSALKESVFNLNSDPSLLQVSQSTEV